MASDFANKVVMITGAGGNLGQAAARRFKEQGARLVLVGRSESELSALASELGAMAGVADVTDSASIDGLVQQVEQTYGAIDILVHTVGGYAAGQPVHETGLDVWDKMMMLNARSLFVTAGRVARHMVEQGSSGRIVAILAKQAYKGSANHAAYAASKAAAQRIIESMALELLEHGISVNGIAPNTIDTPQNRAAMPKADPSKWLTPDEIAASIVFLAAESSSGITGVTLDLAGR